MKFAIIGGDMRQAKLSELLSADGHTVSAYALDKIRLEEVLQTASVKDAADDAKCVILPLPLTSKDGILNTPLSGGLHTTRDILSVLGRSRSSVQAGLIRPPMTWPRPWGCS